MSDLKCYRCSAWPCTCSDGQTIIHGDCREVLPLLEPVDLVLTDPPYGMEFQSNYRNVKHNPIVGDDCLPLDVIDTCKHLATHAVYMWCRCDNLAAIPKPKSVIAWVKNNHSMGDLEHEHGRKWEACAFYPLSKHQFTNRIPDVLFADRTGNSLHPTQKPVSLFSQIIHANVCKTVLDPFLGSGTTLRACKDLGRRGIGIEIDERYCEIAANRLRQEVLF